MKRIDETQVDFLVGQLGKMVTAGKQAQEREISSLGLKAVVAELPTGKGAQNVATKLTPVLVAGLSSKASAKQPYAHLSALCPSNYHQLFDLISLYCIQSQLHLMKT